MIYDYDDLFERRKKKQSNKYSNIINSADQILMFGEN